MTLERKVMLLLAAVFMAAMMALSAAPVSAAEHGSRGGGATIEEFVCYRSTGEKIRLGTGKIVTTPSGKTHTVCTGKPIS